DALDLALRLLRTDATGDRGQSVVVEQAVRGLGQVAFGEQFDKARDVDAHRAARDALRVLALEAALGFEQGCLLRQTEVDFVKVGGADQRVLLRHLLAVDLEALLGSKLGGHGNELKELNSLQGLQELQGSGGSLKANLASALFAGGEGALLEVAVGGQPVHQQVEVHLVPVELRAIDAGEQRLAADRHAAATAHARAVHHHWVERDDRADAQRLGQIDYRAHHGHWPYRIDNIDAARRQRVFGGVGHKAMTPVTAVVGPDIPFPQPPQLSLEDAPLLRTPADDAEHGDSATVQALGNGMHHSGADAAPDAERAARGNQFRGVAKRSGDVGNGLARLQRDQLLGALAHRLDDQRNGARARVRVGDGQGNPLRALAPVHNDELAGLPDLRNAWGDDIQPRDVRAELGFGN